MQPGSPCCWLGLDLGPAHFSQVLHHLPCSRPGLEPAAETVLVCRTSEHVPSAAGSCRLSCAVRKQTVLAACMRCMAAHDNMEASGMVLSDASAPIRQAAREYAEARWALLSAPDAGPGLSFPPTGWEAAAPAAVTGVCGVTCLSPRSSAIHISRACCMPAAASLTPAQGAFTPEGHASCHSSVIGTCKEHTQGQATAIGMYRPGWPG